MWREVAIQDWLDTEWMRCKGWLAKALEHGAGTHTIDDVEKMIAKRELQFWPGQKGACVTEIIYYPRKRFVNVFLCGGDWKECLKIGEDYIEPWARENGCSAVIQQGRKGWLRRLPKFGWKPLHYVMIREFET
jgi:hypothetical protein